MTVEGGVAEDSLRVPPDAASELREPERTAPAPQRALLGAIPAQAAAQAVVDEGVAVPIGSAPVTVPTPPRRRFRPWRILPTPTGTPFTFVYAAVLIGTSLFAQYADPDLVSSALHESSTDASHLAQTPVFVLVASALWIAGGITSTYAVGFLVVLTALERRIGGWRTACVFLLGHAVATLATEVPVGLSVLMGHLPESSLHRLDYGISFGVAASVGALAGLFPPWLRWTVLGVFGGMLISDLVEFADPLTDWGHIMALCIGVATWPLVRRWRRTPGSRVV
ncbi:rhomboid-like protein [Streptomyces sp. NPDC046821]|uniref:rhomboid-like protein n=1 Tax=Streptomyces sp. NPDC046821 TaxID=3154702 RepID=UPI003401CC6E